MVVHKINAEDMGESYISQELRHSHDVTSGREKSHSFFRRFQEYANINLGHNNSELRRTSSLTALEDISNNKTLPRKHHKYKKSSERSRLSSESLRHSIDTEFDLRDDNSDGFRTPKLRQNNMLSSIRVTGIEPQERYEDNKNRVPNDSKTAANMSASNGVIGVKKKPLRSRNEGGNLESYDSDSTASLLHKVGTKLLQSKNKSGSSYQNSKSNIPRSRSLMELHQEYSKIDESHILRKSSSKSTDSDKRPRSQSLTRKNDQPSNFQRGQQERSSERSTYSYSGQTSDHTGFQRGNPERRSEHGTSSSYYSARANHTHLRRQKWKEHQKHAKEGTDNVNNETYKSSDAVSEDENNGSSWERMRQYDNVRRKNTTSESEDVRRSRSSLLIDTKPTQSDQPKKDRAKSAEYSLSKRNDSAKSGNSNSQHRQRGKRALPQLPASTSKDVEERRKRISAAALERVQKGLHALRNEVKQELDSAHNKDAVQRKDDSIDNIEGSCKDESVDGLKVSGLDDSDASFNRSSVNNNGTAKDEGSLITPVLDSKYLEKTLKKDFHSSDDELVDITKNKQNKINTKLKSKVCKSKIEAKKDETSPQKKGNLNDVKDLIKEKHVDVINTSADVNGNIEPKMPILEINDEINKTNITATNHQLTSNITNQSGIIKPEALRYNPRSMTNTNDISADAIQKLIHDLRHAASKPISSNESSSVSCDTISPRSFDQTKDNRSNEKSSPRSCDLNKEQTYRTTASSSHPITDQIEYTNNDQCSVRMNNNNKPKRPSLFKIAQTCDLISVTVQNHSDESLKSQFKLYEAPYFEGANACGIAYIIRPPVGRRQTIRPSGAFAPVTSVTPPTHDEPVRAKCELSLVAVEILNSDSSSPCYQGIFDGDFIIEINQEYIVPLCLSDVEHRMMSASGPLNITVARPKQHPANPPKGEPETAKEFDKMKFKFDSLKEDADRNLDTIADLRCVLKDKDARIRHLEDKLRSNKGYYTDLEAEIKQKDAKVMEWMLEVNKRDRELARLKVETKHMADKTEQLKRLLLQQTEVMQLQEVNGYTLDNDFEMDEEKVSAV